MLMKNNLSLITIIFAIVFSLLISSCGKKNKNELLTAEEAFREAMEKFQKGKYLDASEKLTLVTLNYSGSAIIDSAQYYLAESHFKMKEYLIAASEFQRLVFQFPSSPLCDDGKYKIGLSYFLMSPKYGLDQEFTRKSVEEFQEFTEEYPESELVPEVIDKIFAARKKLAKKLYKSGELYFKMQDYESAVIYLSEVLDNYYDTEYAQKALLKKGESYLKMKKFEDADAEFKKVIEKYPDTKESIKAKEILNKIETDSK